MPGMSLVQKMRSHQWSRHAVYHPELKYTVPSPSPPLPSPYLMSFGQGAEVTLGTSMAGDLYPFVITFPPPPPPSQQQQHRLRSAGGTKPHAHAAPPPLRPAPRRNTEDFMFTGVLDAAKVAGVSNGDPAGPGLGQGQGQAAGDNDRRQAVGVGAVPPLYQHHSSRGGGALGIPDRNGLGNGGGGGAAEWRASSLRDLGEEGFTLPPGAGAMFDDAQYPGVRQSVRSRGVRSVSPAARTLVRKTLHLGCETEEQTLEWARCVCVFGWVGG